MIYYNVHGLAHLSVDENVGPAVVDSIDFQLGSFRVNSDSQTGGQTPGVDILPYELFASNRAEIETSLPSFHDKKAQLAIVRDGMNICAYVESGNFIINVFLQFVLAGLGMSQIHSAAVANSSGKVTLFPAEGGVGKTALAGYLVLNQEHRILGDDIAIIDKSGMCYSVPRAFILKNYHTTVFPDVEKELGVMKWWRWNFDIGSAVLENIPFRGFARNHLRRTRPYLAAAKALGILNNGKAVPITKVFGDEKIIPSGPVERVVFLQKEAGVLRWETSNAEAIASLAFSIIHEEWRAFLGSMFRLGSFGVVDMAAYFAAVQAAILGCFSGKEIVVMKVPPRTTGNEMGEFYMQHI